MIKDDNRLLLKQRIYDFLRNKISIVELENSELFKTSNQSEAELLKNIFHAVQHFDADFNVLSDNEKENMKLKLKQIADCLIENDENLKNAINVFFNDPYS